MWIEIQAKAIRIVSKCKLKIIFLNLKYTIPIYEQQDCRIIILYAPNVYIFFIGCPFGTFLTCCYPHRTKSLYEYTFLWKDESYFCMWIWWYANIRVISCHISRNQRGLARYVVSSKVNPFTTASLTLWGEIC